MLKTAAQIRQRFEQAKGHRINFENTWQEIADYQIGFRDVTVIRAPGRQRMQRIYDTTALHAAGLLAGGLQSLLMNPATKWFDLHVDNVDEDDPEIAFWLEDTEKKMRRAYHRPIANFMPQMAETLLDIVAFGTGTNFIAEDEHGPRFSSRPVNEIYTFENQYGQVDTVFRDFKMTARQIELEWTGRSEVASRHIRGNRSETEMHLLHLVHPQPDPVHPLFGRLPWRSVYVSCEDNAILAEGGFHENPYLVGRWTKESGETYGRGPGWTALSDAKMLCEMGKATIQLAQLSARPPLMVPNDGVIRQVNMGPNSINVVAADLLARGVNPIQPLQVGGNWPITRDVVEQYRQSVRNAYHAQLFQLFEDPRMTATQVLELVSQVQRLLAPTLGRLQNEVLDPMQGRVFGILRRSKRLLPPPPALRGRELRIEYVSPVMKAQAVAEARSTLETWQAAGAIAQVDPTVLDNLDADESIRVIAAANQAPLSILRSREDVEKRRSAAAEAEEENDQLAKVAMLSKAAAPMMNRETVQ